MSRLNRRILSTIAIVLCACSSSSDSPATADAPDGGLSDPKVIAELRDIGLRASSGAGVPSPKTMIAVAASDEQAAEMIVSGGSIPSHAPVYVIEITGGTFTANMHPPGVAAPQGKFLIIIVDAATLDVKAVSYVNEGPNLDEIGPVQVDLNAG